MKSVTLYGALPKLTHLHDQLLKNNKSVLWKVNPSKNKILVRSLFKWSKRKHFGKSAGTIHSCKWSREPLQARGFNIGAAHCPPPLCSAGGQHCPDVSQVIWSCFKDLTADLRAFSTSHNLWITPWNDRAAYPRNYLYTCCHFRSFPSGHNLDLGVWFHSLQCLGFGIKPCPHMVCSSAFCLEVWEQLYLNAFSQELKTT